MPINKKSGGPVRRALRRSTREAVACISITPDTDAQTHVFFINATQGALKIRAIKYFNEVLEGGAATAGIYIGTTGSALASGRLATAASTTINLNANDNTLNSAALHATNSLYVQPNEVLGIVLSKNIGTAVACVAVDLIPA